MFTRQEFTVELPRERAALSRLNSALSQASVTIDALSLGTTSNGLRVRIVASPTNTTKAVIKRSRFTFRSRTVLVLRGDSDPERLACATAILASRRIEIEYVYRGGASGPKSPFVLGVCDPSRAARSVKGRVSPQRRHGPRVHITESAVGAVDREYPSQTTKGKDK